MHIFLNRLEGVLLRFFQKLGSHVGAFHPRFCLVRFYPCRAVPAGFSTYCHWITESSGFDYYSFAFYGVVFFCVIVQEKLGHAICQLSWILPSFLACRKLPALFHNSTLVRRRHRWGILVFFSWNISSGTPLWGFWLLRVELPWFRCVRRLPRFIPPQTLQAIMETSVLKIDWELRDYCL